MWVRLGLAELLVILVFVAFLFLMGRIALMLRNRARANAARYRREIEPRALPPPEG